MIIGVEINELCSHSNFSICLYFRTKILKTGNIWAFFFYRGHEQIRHDINLTYTAFTKELDKHVSLHVFPETLFTIFVLLGDIIRFYWINSRSFLLTLSGSLFRLWIKPNWVYFPLLYPCQRFVLSVSTLINNYCPPIFGCNWLRSIPQRKLIYTSIRIVVLILKWLIALWYFLITTLNNQCLDMLDIICLEVLKLFSSSLDFNLYQTLLSENWLPLDN